MRILHKCSCFIELNESRKSLFRIKFDKFNNTGARMLDSICHVTFKLLDLKMYFLHENARFFIF